MNWVTAEQCHILWPAGIALRREGQKNQQFCRRFSVNEGLARMRHRILFDRVARIIGAITGLPHC